MCFFFSSRRRHTRYIGDWSSDVCSSDLGRSPGCPARRTPRTVAAGGPPRATQIGRASCRERVWDSEGDATDKEGEDDILTSIDGCCKGDEAIPYHKPMKATGRGHLFHDD